MRKLLTISLFSCFCLLAHFLVQTARAADFLFDYDVSYNVTAIGKTHVSEDITLTNNTTEFLAQNFTLSVQSERIDNVTAADPEGVISVQVSKSQNQTTMTVPFHVKIGGFGKGFVFHLNYDTDEIAQKKGTIWEIIIPGIENKDELRSYKVHLFVPPAFGKPAYLVPPPDSNGTWSLAGVKSSGITAAYGTNQQFAFNLIYHLENTGNTAVIEEITLPPDTAYQKTVLNRLSMQPINVRLDQDGNWLASYKLMPHEKIRVVAEGSVLIYARPRSDFVTPLTAAERLVYTTSHHYWETTPEMKQKAKELGTPKAIYDYVVGTLTYDTGRVSSTIERLGATYVYSHPTNAVCMEFSDLFVALARSAGIPAREVHGYAYTTNSKLQPLSLVTDVLHAWVEYYDDTSKQWIAVDPTWGNTTHGIDYFSKFDFNHITFAILGAESDYPYPAGAFKGSTDGKDVFVDFLTEPVKLTPVAPQIEVSFSRLPVWGMSRSGQINVTNVNPTLLTTQSINVQSIYPISYAKNQNLIIPPYGTAAVAFQIAPPFSLNQTTFPFTITLAGKQVTKEITIAPLYITYWQYVLLVFVLGLVLIKAIFLKHGQKRHQNTTKSPRHL